MPQALPNPLNRVPLVWPTELRLSEGEASGPTRKWIQIAKTGTFFSSRYGKFEITKDDLSTMLTNFRTVTPIAPTQLPIDYDHLSMDPKKPGDGKAAGWFAGGMELRDGGDTLWAETEFTPSAAEHIRHKEYRFISPSFVKNYVWKNGKNIGTTLIAAAITNHPFLEGMSAITLSNHLGELAVDLCQCQPGGAVEVGQIVALKADVDPKRAGAACEILEVAGTGADAFARLKLEDGKEIPGWYRISDLEPAVVSDPAAIAATPPSPVATHMSEGQMPEVFTLRDVRGATAEIKSDDVQKFVDEQVAAAKDAKAKEIVPEGSVVISASKLGEFEQTAQTVTSLRQEVTNLREQNEAASRDAHVAHITKHLDGLSQSGKITKPERDHLLKTYSDPISLTAFNEYFPILAGRPAVVTNLHSTVGVGSSDEGQPSNRPDSALLAAAQAMASQANIPLRDAIKRVSAERVDLSNDYRESTPDVSTLRGRHTIQ